MHVLRSIHLFSPLLEGGRFHVYLTAHAQNAVPRIFAFWTSCDLISSDWFSGSKRRQLSVRDRERTRTGLYKRMFMQSRTVMDAILLPQPENKAYMKPIFLSCTERHLPAASFSTLRKFDKLWYLLLFSLSAEIQSPSTRKGTCLCHPSLQLQSRSIHTDH